MSDAFQSLALLGGAVVVSAAVVWLAFAVATLVIRRRHRGGVLQGFLKRAHRPTYLLVATLALLLVLPGAPLSGQVHDPLEHAIGLLALAAVGWLAIGATHLTGALIVRHYDGDGPVDATDTATVRRVHTQTAVLRRVIVFVIVVIVASAMLMTFARARALGASLLASAGIAGIVIGMAARPTLGNVVAGLQIALTNSLSLEDAVIVEGDWGRVEEITLTYVVVRVWDGRRIILPSEYFVTTPFQNWTRVNEQLTGVVYLYVDYTVPVDEVRAEVTRIAHGSPDWDGKVCAVQVVDVTERTVQLRVLVSGSTSGSTFNVRCAAREGLIAFLRDRYPHALPRARVDISDDDVVPHQRGRDGVNRPPEAAREG